MSNRVAFVGAGRWALALAVKLSERGHATALWEANAANLDRLLATRRHPDLPGAVKVPDSANVSGDLKQILTDAEFIVFAVPSDALVEAARLVLPLVGRAKAMVTVTKGIDPTSLKRMSVVIREILGKQSVVVLAGPGIPYDMALGDPTSLLAASDDEPAAVLVRDVFTGGNLRVYSHSDVVGVELGAALKNVMAIAAGICDGIGLGINAKAALLSRGLAEMIRLGVAFNANPLTFAGLSGMGDLIVTAFSSHSRNHVVGERIGKGQTPEAARASLAGVAEGMTTARSARTLAARQRVEMPITEEVCRILFESASPRDSIERLLRRRPKPENW